MQSQLIVSYRILSYPILSYPILSYPILSYFHLFLSTHLTIPSHPDHAIPYHVCSILLWHLQNWSPKDTYEIVVFCGSRFIIRKLYVEHNNSKATFNDFFIYLFVRFTFFSWFYCIFAIEFLAFFLIISILIWHFWGTYMSKKKFKELLRKMIQVTFIKQILVTKHIMKLKKRLNQ